VVVFLLIFDPVGVGIIGCGIFGQPRGLGNHKFWATTRVAPTFGKRTQRTARTIGTEYIYLCNGSFYGFGLINGALASPAIIGRAIAPPNNIALAGICLRKLKGVIRNGNAF